MSNLPYPLIIDGHNDTVLELIAGASERGRSFFERGPHGHLDLPRAREGGLGGGFFAVFVPSAGGRPDASVATNAPDASLPPPLDPVYARERAIRALAALLRVERASGGSVKITRTADEIRTCLQDGTLAMILHIEGAESIDPELDTLELFYAAGLRSLGITWSRPTLFATGVPFAFPASPDIGPGLTDAGYELVKGCNRLGILIDLSHLNEQGFWDVAKTSDAPLVATHSGAHALSASPRNLTDGQLDAIKASGGMVGVNYHIGFLRADGRTDLETSLTEIVNHVDYMVNRMGIDHVGFGSDFDGARMPHDLVDAAGLPKLMAELAGRGYDRPALAKLANENWLRVLDQTWKKESP